MKSIIEKSLAKSYTYSEYRNQVKELLKEGKSSGNEQSEDLLKYSELNEVRMNRLEKTLAVPNENKGILQNLKRDYIWLVLAEGWCGDVGQVLPIIYKMAEVSEKIELKVVFRDENDTLMNEFLTNGTRSIPKLIIIDKNAREVLGDFGPRPLGAKQLILNYKAKHGIVDQTAKEQLQLWYLHDKGLSTQKEIIEIMEALEI